MQGHVVPVPEYFLLCIPHTLYAVQHNRLAISCNQEMEPGHPVIDRLFLVCTGHLVRLGVLPLYRLALGRTGTPWLPRSAKLLHSFPASKTYWY